MHNEPRVVLVVESEPDDLLSTVALIESMGHEVVVATTFDGGRQELGLRRPDLLVTGLRLGLRNGLELVIRSAWMHPDLPAIVTARHPDPVLRLETERLNAVYLERPLDPARFLTTVSTLLESSGTRNGIEPLADLPDIATTPIRQFR